MNKLFTVCLAPLLVCCLVAVSSAETYVFQDGLNGYTGTRDDSITGNWGAELSQGASQTVYLNGLPGAGGKGPGFIGFDNIFGTGAGQINPSLTITSAKLKVYVTTSTGGGRVDLHPMLTPWVEGTSAGWASVDGASTMNHRYYRASGSYVTGDFWGTGGVITAGPVSDVDFPGLWGSHPLKSLSKTVDLASVGTWMEFNVTDVVQAWQSGTIANNGWYLYCNGYWNTLYFNSSEYTADPSLRPKLEITALTIEVPANTAIFKQNYNGYSGSRDDTITGNWGGELSQGTSPYVYLAGVPVVGAGNRPGFIGFDNLFGTGDGQVPNDAYIKSAKLKVYVTTRSGVGRVDLSPMLTPWVEGTSAGWASVDGASTMNHRYYRASGTYATGDFWGTGGVVTNGPVLDVDYPGLWGTHPYQYLTTTVNFPDANNSWMEFNVIGTVEAWQKGTIANNGWYLWTNAYWNTLDFCSSEYMTDPNKRPELVIEYEPIACGQPGVPYPVMDISGPNGVSDCYVNMYDLKEIALEWLDCTTPGGTGCVQLEAVGVIAQGTATIDGSLTEWSSANWISLDQLYAGTPKDINDAKMALRWDASSDVVYAAIKVRDLEHTLSDFPFAWDSHDHIEVYSQGDITAGDTYDNATCTIAQQYYVGIGETAGYEDAYLGINWYSPPAAFQFASSIDGAWLVYEIAVPQYAAYGGIGGGTTTIKQLNVGDEIRFDVVAFSRYTNPTGYEYKAENTMPEKYQRSSSFRKYKLISSGCGEWGYLDGDFNTDCKVNMKDFADFAADWLYCTDPQNTHCDQTWR